MKILFYLKLNQYVLINFYSIFQKFLFKSFFKDIQKETFLNIQSVHFCNGNVTTKIFENFITKILNILNPLL